MDHSDSKKPAAATTWATFFRLAAGASSVYTMPQPGQHRSDDLSHDERTLQHLAPSLSQSNRFVPQCLFIYLTFY